MATSGKYTHYFNISLPPSFQSFQRLPQMLTFSAKVLIHDVRPKIQGSWKSPLSVFSQPPSGDRWRCLVWSLYVRLMMIMTMRMTRMIRMITIVRVVKRVRMMTDEDEKKDYGVLKTWTRQDQRKLTLNIQISMNLGMIHTTGVEWPASTWQLWLTTFSPEQMIQAGYILMFHKSWKKVATKCHKHGHGASLHQRAPKAFVGKGL